MAIKSYRYKVWLKQAELDLQAAKLSLGNNFFEWACFQSEQSAEKALKGVMVFCGEKPPKVHKLSILFKIARELRPDLLKQFEDVDSLQAVTFISRYPFIIPGDNLTPHDFMTYQNATDCISEAEKVLFLVKELVNSPNEHEPRF
jgi:HEPN domain-containing protein